jgi:hypothetical protein
VGNSSCDVYDLTLRPELGEFIGKLFVEWGTGKLAWVQYADKRDKPIKEMCNEPAKEAPPKKPPTMSREEWLASLDPKEVASRPLRKSQLACLAVLANAKEPMNGTELAKKAGLDKSVIGGNCGYRNPEINKRPCHAGNLLNRGFVEIEKRDDANGRTRFYYLITEAGRKALAVSAPGADSGEAGPDPDGEKVK